MDKSDLRDAATVILVRDAHTAPRVLMGQRGARAAFMPSKFVFPGGAVDRADADLPATGPLHPACAARLADDAAPRVDPAALAGAAIRELWEETGLVLGRPGTWAGPVPPAWTKFANTGHRPGFDALRFVFRAITPPGRPRRFDARFFAADATAVAGDLDDFSAATDELSNLRWVPLSEVRALDLPFITEVVLAEVAARLPALDPPETVPFFRNDDEESLFQRLGGQRLL